MDLSKWGLGKYFGGYDKETTALLKETAQKFKAADAAEKAGNLSLRNRLEDEARAAHKKAEKQIKQQKKKR